MQGKVEPIFVETVDELTAAILNVAQDNDVVLVMGAGSVSGVAPGVLRGFATHEETAIAADATPVDRLPKNALDSYGYVRN